MKRKLNRLLIATTLFAPVGAFALGLGQIQTRSALNQPLNAEIEVTTLGQYELEQLSAQLASAQAFTQSGLDRPRYLSDLTFALQTRPDGTAFIKVTSSRPIREPIINFLMELQWPRGRLVREFAVFLDPPSAVSNLPARPALSAPVAQPPAPPTSPPPAQETPSVTLQTGVPQGTETYTVPYGDTLWGIAQRVRPHSSISIQKMMGALYQANPGAFSRQSMDSLQAGAVLRIPSVQEIDPSIDPALATRPAIAQPAPAEPTQPQAAPIEPQPQVRLVPPDEQAVFEVPPPAVPAPVPAAPVEPSVAIKLNQGRLQLKVAGLDDIRNRVSALAQVDSAALAAIQQDGQTAAPEETAPEPVPSEPPPVVEAVTPPAPETPPVAEFQEVIPEPMVPPQAETVPAEETAEPPIEETSPAEEPTTVAPEAETPAPEPVAETAPSSTETPSEVAAPVEPVAEQPTFDLSDPLGSLSALLRQPMFKSPAAWALIGFVLLLLIALPVMFLRRKKTEDKEEEDSLFTDKRSSTKEAVLEKQAPIPSAVGDTTIKKPIPARSAPKPATNPLERVDLLMAVGNYPEAENTARLALREEPNNTALAAKLLDIHFATKNQDEFLRDAQALHDKLNNKTDPIWSHVVQMGKTLIPNHALFGGTVQTQPATIPNKPKLSDQPERAERAKPAKPAKPAENPFGALDFESFDQGKETSEKPKPSATQDILGDLDGLDWQLPDIEPTTATTTGKPLAEEHQEDLPSQLVPEQSAPQNDFEDQLKNLNFDFEPTTQSPPGQDDDSPLTQFPDLDIASGESPLSDQNDGKEEKPISAMSASAEDYVETKLDLATAYLEMGDPVGARTLLEEVMQEGNAKQKERAEEFMGKLP